VGINQQRISQITNNTSFGDIGNLLSRDLVLDPMAGGAVVPDTCLLFERKCQAFDLAAPQDKQAERPEIEYHYWESAPETWPITRKPDLIFMDPPYYTKKKKAYQKKAYQEKASSEKPSISSFSRKAYKGFFKDFFILAHKNTKPDTTLAFLNAPCPRNA